MARKSKNRNGGYLETLYGVVVIALFVVLIKKLHISLGNIIVIVFWASIIFAAVLLYYVVKGIRLWQSDSTSSLASIEEIDKMNGYDFEYFCAKLLRNDGFTNVNVTQASNDQGVDITASKNGIQYAIQCKRYSKNLGNKPVQEVYAGQKLYNCSKAIVMTNRYFTEGAQQAAEATGVILWDRDKLSSLIRTQNMDIMANNKERNKIEGKQIGETILPNPTAWPHNESSSEIDLRYYMDLPHVNYVDGQKQYVKMYMKTQGEPKDDDIVELISEEFLSYGEAEHFARAITKHCYAITRIEDKKVIAKIHFYSITANGIENGGEYFAFANWA